MATKKTQGRFQKKAAQKAAPASENTAPNNKETKRSAGTIACVLCICVSILACVYFLGKLGVSITLPGKTIAPGVTVAGVDVGGLKRSEAVEAVSSAIGNAYAENSMKVTVLEQELEISPTLSGAALDVEGAVKDALSYTQEGNASFKVDLLPHLSLNEEDIRNRITQFGEAFPTDGIASGSQIITETVDGQETEILEVTLGTVYYDFNADALYNAILDAYNDFKFHTVYTCNRMDAAAVDLDALYARYCSDPVDAVLDPDSHQVTQSSNGYQFDMEAAREAMSNAAAGDVLKFPLYDVLPDMDTETLKSMLFRDELATYTAYQSSGSNRATNLRLACEALDGKILYPGDTFSYNDTLGQRTPEKGYKQAAAYMDGETVQSYGGGICQPSSALYYCTLLADLEIVQRHCHTYPSSYVPMGMDATVSWGGPDFKFKNDTDFPIRIDAKADGGSVTVTLVGTETKDYYVKMEYEILGVTSPKVKEIEVKPGSGHKDGEVKTSGHTGYTVQSYKLKYSKETNELISREKEAYSVYSMQERVIYKVIQEDKPEETTPTEPKPTDPPATEPKPTDPPATEPKPTDPPATEPKPTDPPATEPKPTDPPATEPKPTDPPATEPAPSTPPVIEIEPEE